MNVMSNLPILYSFRRCPYAMRARLAVQSSGNAVELREIVLRDKAAEFLAVSASATVPALVAADGLILDESLDIMIWALRGNDPENWLIPPGIPLDAQLAIIATIDGPFKTSLDRYKYESRFADVDPRDERQIAGSYLMALEARLQAAAWLFGERISLADMAILPFVRQFANVDRDWFDNQNWPALRRWLIAFEGSGRFAAIMTKYPRWVSGDEPVLFAA